MTTSKKLSKESFGLILVRQNLYELIAPRDMNVSRNTFDIDTEVAVTIPDGYYGLIISHYFCDRRFLLRNVPLYGENSSIVLYFSFPGIIDMNDSGRIVKRKAFIPRASKLAYLIICKC